MTDPFPCLFAPVRIGGLTLRNRIVMAPMQKNLALPAGATSQQYVDYCEARAAGGAARVLLESMYVHPAGKNHRDQLGLHDDDLVPGDRRLIEACPPPGRPGRGAAPLRDRRLPAPPDGRRGHAGGGGAGPTDCRGRNGMVTC